MTRMRSRCTHSSAPNSSVTAIRLSIARLSKNAGSGAACGGGWGAVGGGGVDADIDSQNSGCAAGFKAAAILDHSVTTATSPAAAARRVILSSALIGALSSFAMNAIVPALPRIQQHFATRIETTQLIVSGGFLALALGNLLVAPLSDRVGRKPVVLAGVLAFALASVAAWFADHIAVVIGARIVQAFGIGAGAAVARAALNDHFGPERAATGIAWTAMTILFVPLVAPSIGGFATDAWGWRSPFALSPLFGIG